MIDLCGMDSGNWKKWVYIWLWAGFIMILFQIFLGGVTRLTGSGLSITKWDIVTGIKYPFSESEWDIHFNLYKKTPQYLKINSGINLTEFKYIFFWEYFHRLWARLMGFVFVIPFIIFLLKRVLPKSLIIDLLVVILLASLVASLGWIMVASGLVNRPWVNAYKLSFHLLAAVALLSYLLWTIWKYRISGSSFTMIQSSFTYGMIVLIPIMLIIQVGLGGVMAGMKAALVAPTWPDINGVWIPEEIKSIGNYSDYLFNEYELNASSGIIMHFLHRGLAYVIAVLSLILFVLSYKLGDLRVFRNSFIIFILVIMQLILGVLTILGSVGQIPIWFAVSHQLLGIGLYSMSIYNLFGVKRSF